MSYEHQGDKINVVHCNSISATYTGPMDNSDLMYYLGEYIRFYFRDKKVNVNRNSFFINLNKQDMLSGKVLISPDGEGRKVTIFLYSSFHFCGLNHLFKGLERVIQNSD